MTECINNAQFNNTLQQSSKTIFDGTNNSLVQQGQTMNIFIGNVVTQVQAILAAIAGITVTPEDIDTTGISSGIVDPSGKDLAEWLTGISTYLEKLSTTVSGLDAGDIDYTADFSTIGKTNPTNIEEALDSLLEYVEDFKSTDLYSALQKIEMPLYPFYTGSLTITDVTVTTPQIEIADLTAWGRNGYINKEAEVVDLTDDKDNYVFLPAFMNLVPLLFPVKYGYMYNWYALKNASNLTSSATWEVPTKTQVDTLITYVGGYVVGTSTKLRSIRVSPDDAPRWTNTAGTDNYGFAAQGTGQRQATYVYLGLATFITSLTEETGDPVNYALSALLTETDCIDNVHDKWYGMPVRLMRAATVPEQALDDGTPCDDYVGNNGRRYKTVKIGTQVWTAENLAETLYRDGTLIPKIADATTWAADTTGAYCSYDNDDANALIFPSDISDYPTKYNVKTVAIGGAVPDSNDILVAKITVTGGVVGTPTVALQQYPILNDLIADSAIKGRNISMADTFSEGFTQDAGTKIISPVVQKSLELSSGIPQLKNDINAPGNHKYYGTNAVGTKGFFDFPYYSKGSSNFFQFADGSKGFLDVEDAYGVAKYEGNGAYTFGVRSDAIGDNSFVFGTANASKGEFAIGSNNTVQSSNIRLECETTDNTPTYMTVDGEWISFREDTVNRISIEMVAADFDTTVAAIFDTLTFAVFNDGGTLTIPKTTPSAQTENTTYSDLTSVQYEVEIISNVLYIKVTGKAGSTIRWGAKISKVEINNKLNLS